MQRGKTLNYLDIVNNSLREIGKVGAEVSQMQDDIFMFDLTSIEKILLLAKIEELSGLKVCMEGLGIKRELTVEDLAISLMI